MSRGQIRKGVMLALRIIIQYPGTSVGDEASGVHKPARITQHLMSEVCQVSVCSIVSFINMESLGRVYEDIDLKFPILKFGKPISASTLDKFLLFQKM